MRASVLIAATCLIAGPAAAAQTSIEVQIGPELRKAAVESLGVQEVERLAADLKRELVRSLDRTGVLDGARLELVLVDAKPNHPTIRQLADKPGLSIRSYSVGGAAIEGKAIAIDGAVTPLRYHWYETDIRNENNPSTWADADTAFYQFADRLSRGDTLYEP